MRANATKAERKLWAALSSRQLGGFKFRRQHPIDRYFVDFACAEKRLVVELDGGQHTDQADYDAARTDVLEACGWRVLRIWNNEVIENIDGVVIAILAELHAETA